MFWPTEPCRPGPDNHFLRCSWNLLGEILPYSSGQSWAGCPVAASEVALEASPQIHSLLSWWLYLLLSRERVGAWFCLANSFRSHKTHTAPSGASFRGPLLFFPSSFLSHCLAVRASGKGPINTGQSSEWLSHLHGTFHFTKQFHLIFWGKAGPAHTHSQVWQPRAARA